MSSIWVAAVAAPNRKLPRPASPDSEPNPPNVIALAASSPQPASASARSQIVFTPRIVPENRALDSGDRVPILRGFDGQGHAISGACTGSPGAPDVRSVAGARRRMAQGPAE